MSDWSKSICARVVVPDVNAGREIGTKERVLEAHVRAHLAELAEPEFRL